MPGKNEETQIIYTYIKSLVIVCEPLAKALNSTPVKSTDLGCFHSISFPLKQVNMLYRCEVCAQDIGNL